MSVPQSYTGPYDKLIPFVDEDDPIKQKQLASLEENLLNFHICHIIDYFYSRLQ